MNKIPPELRYTESHEWVRMEEDGTLTVGITDYGQSQLGEIISVELPDLGAALHAADDACLIESNKTGSDIYAPVSGKVIEVNEDLEEAPALVSTDPYGDGWLFKIAPTDPEEFSELLEAEAYQEYMEEDED